MQAKEQGEEEQEGKHAQSIAGKEGHRSQAGKLVRGRAVDLKSNKTEVRDEVQLTQETAGKQRRGGRTERRSGGVSQPLSSGSSSSCSVDVIVRAASCCARTPGALDTARHRPASP